MSKYIESIPLADIERIAIVQGNGRLVARVKRDTGCDRAINAGFFGGDGKPTHHLKADGKVLSRAPWGCWGFSWDGGGDIRMEGLPADGKKNYIAGVELLSPMVSDMGEIQYDRKGELGGIRGRTAIGLTGDGGMGHAALLLYCSGDGTVDAATLEGVQEELRRLGAEAAVYVDGGGSSQCDFGEGKTIYSSRKVYSYLCVWLKKKEDKPVGKKFKVCIDPGHGPGCPNGAPDGTYKEDEFAQYMGYAVQRHLERCGVEVVVTRSGSEFPSLIDRAKVSNEYVVDLLVSLHTNAPASKSLDKDGWCESARGLLVYTSAAGESAGRNKAARAVLARLKEAGVALSGGGLLHEGWTVLVRAAASAILIEYGFHTSRGDVARLKDHAYREKLAAATAKGACDYLGVAWVEEAAPAPGVPWYAEDQKWVKAMGISDGTRPEENITRAEVWAMLRRSAEHPGAGD